MTGYHFTSWENWQHIQYEGLKQYTIHNLDGMTGIFMWKKRQTGRSLLGSLLYHLSNKVATTIVLLEVTFHPKDRWNKDGRVYVTSHIGEIGNWHYHRGRAAQEQAWIVQKDVPPERIKLLKTYDLLELTK